MRFAKLESLHASMIWVGVGAHGVRLECGLVWCGGVWPRLGVLTLKHTPFGWI